MNEQLHMLCLSMIEYYKGDSKRIQHFIKVHAFSNLIGRGENISENELFILEAAAYTHDIGILTAEQKYGYNNGKLQEQFGPEPAREMLTRLQFDADSIRRICFLIAHHHTYSCIDGNDYQILVEADFLVNLQEENSSVEAVVSARNKIFKTKTGIKLINTVFGLQDK